MLNEGTYSFDATVVLTAGSITRMGIYKNGNLVSSSTTGNNVAVHSYSVTLNLLANDIISFRVLDTSPTLSNSTSHTLQCTYQGSLKQVSVNPNSKITIPTSELRFEGASSRGSTATAIVKFDTLAKIRGDAFTVVSNSVDGTYITMKKAGKLDVQSTVTAASSFTFGISKNQTTLT